MASCPKKKNTKNPHEVQEVANKGNQKSADDRIVTKWIHNSRVQKNK